MYSIWQSENALDVPIALKLHIVWWKTILRVQYFDILMLVHGVSGVTAYKLNCSLWKLKLAEDCFHTISVWEFDTIWPFTNFYHNCYTLGLEILYSYMYVSHEHEYFLFFYCRVVEADRGLPVIEVDCFRRLKWLSRQSHVQLSDSAYLRGPPLVIHQMLIFMSLLGRLSQLVVPVVKHTIVDSEVQQCSCKMGKFSRPDGIACLFNMSYYLNVIVIDAFGFCTVYCCLWHTREWWGWMLLAPTVLGSLLSEFKYIQPKITFVTRSADSKSKFIEL